MAELIHQAAEDLDAAMELAGSLPDVERLFGGVEGLLLSLEQRWVMTLMARLDQAEYEEVPADLAVANLAAEQYGLRGLLDAAARRWVRVRSQERDDEWIVTVYGGAPGLGASDARGARAGQPGPN